MAHAAATILGYEKVLADLDPDDYGILGRYEELLDNMPAMPGLSSTYQALGNSNKRVVRRFVQNVRGSALSTGMVVVWDRTSGSYIFGVSTTTSANLTRPKVAGIVVGDVRGGTFDAPATVADDSILDIVIKADVMKVRCASGVAAGDSLGTSTTAGVLDTTTTADARVAEAITAAATADGGSTYTCYAVVNCTLS